MSERHTVDAWGNYLSARMRLLVELTFDGRSEDEIIQGVLVDRAHAQRLLVHAAAIVKLVEEGRSEPEICETLCLPDGPERDWVRNLIARGAQT